MTGQAPVTRRCSTVTNGERCPATWQTGNVTPGWTLGAVTAYCPVHSGLTQWRSPRDASPVRHRPVSPFMARKQSTRGQDNGR